MKKILLSTEKIITRQIFIAIQMYLTESSRLRSLRKYICVRAIPL